MKKCNRCHTEQILSNFNKRNSTKDGLNYMCKFCQSTDNKKYNDILKENGYFKNYFYENKESLKNYVKLNKETIIKTKTKYRLNNQDKIKESQKKWRLKNPHNTAFRNVLKNSLIRLGKEKEDKTINLLSYSALELKQHITYLFTDGMSWDNYGEWHIDHIKPVFSFDNNTPMNIVNALSNLRPMWATTREINGVIYEGNLNKNKF